MAAVRQALRVATVKQSSTVMIVYCGEEPDAVTVTWTLVALALYGDEDPRKSSPFASQKHCTLVLFLQEDSK